MLIYYIENSIWLSDILSSDIFSQNQLYSFIRVRYLISASRWQRFSWWKAIVINHVWTACIDRKGHVSKFYSKSKRKLKNSFLSEIWKRKLGENLQELPPAESSSFDRLGEESGDRMLTPRREDVLASDISRKK